MNRDRFTEPTQCAQWTQVVLLDAGELNWSQRVAAHFHLTHCESCRQLRQNVGNVHRTMRRTFSAGAAMSGSMAAASFLGLKVSVKVVLLTLITVGGIVAGSAVGYEYFSAKQDAAIASKSEPKKTKSGRRIRPAEVKIPQ